MADVIPTISLPAIQSAEGWNPFYASFARKHGRECADQLRHDRKRYPSVPALPFLMWMSDVRILFGRAHPEALGKRGMIADMELFAQFVDQQAAANG